jgi:hypothetical protein
MNWLTTRVMRMMKRVFMVRSGWVPELERQDAANFSGSRPQFF